jgi:hypothetical protein
VTRATAHPPETTHDPEFNRLIKRQGVLIMWQLFLVSILFGMMVPLTALADRAYFDLHHKNIKIKLPRNWNYNSKQINDHLNTLTESVLKLNKYDIDQGNNQILAAGSLTLKPGAGTVATVRLSVREEPSLSQKDLRAAFANTNDREELEYGSSATAVESANLLMKMDGVVKAEVLSASMKKLNNNVCIFNEVLVHFATDKRVQESYVCLFKKSRVKLSSSYNYDAKEIAKPVLDYIAGSLSIKGD